MVPDRQRSGPGAAFGLKMVPDRQRSGPGAAFGLKMALDRQRLGPGAAFGLKMARYGGASDLGALVQTRDKNLEQ